MEIFSDLQAPTKQWSRCPILSGLDSKNIQQKRIPLMVCILLNFMYAHLTLHLYVQLQDPIYTLIHNTLP